MRDAWPYACTMEKHVSVRWQGDLGFVATSETGASVLMDSTDPPESYRPPTLVLAALAACTGMDAISIMRKKRVPVERYAVDAVGTQRDEHPRIFTAIVVTHVVEGPAIDDIAVARAIELSARKYCTVGATLASGSASINHRFVVRDEAGERTCDCLTIGPHGKGLSLDEAG